MSDIERWCRERAITEVEALMPDMSGVARGKIMPVAAYCRTLGLNLPEALVLQTVTGDYPEDQSAVDPSDRDMVLHAETSARSGSCPGRRSPPRRSSTTASRPTAHR